MKGKEKAMWVLHIIDYWYKKKNGSCKQSDISHISLDKMQFAEDLKDLNKFDAIDYDEAGELSNKRTMSKFNFIINQAYQVIRGDNIFTILTLPSLF
jgi:lipoprotein NlpI